VPHDAAAPADGAAPTGDSSRTVEVDLLIVGAGPTGLFAAYYAGFRAMSVAVLDSLEEPGGQVTAMYPEKLIFDVAGFPAVKGQLLVDALVEQAAAFSPTYLLGERAEALEQAEDAVVVSTAAGTRVTAKAVLITGGIGQFSPRSLPGSEHWEGKGLRYFVPRLSDLAGADVLIVGGGDSAFDWAQSLEPIATSVTLIHRRDRFRAHERTVENVKASACRVLTPYEVREIRGDGHVSGVEIFHNGTEQAQVLDVSEVVAALGFIADLGPFTRWGLELKKRHIVVDQAMRTSLDRVFAAGDIVDYDGKVKLIAVGFGEAATAVNNLAPVVDPSVKVFPGHSSDVG
jgi:thioredoxin reductase (NADPH)